MTNKLKFGQIKPNLGIPINWSNPLAKGLVGYWLMNEGGGNIVQDLSGNGYVGTFQGDEYWAAGESGPAIYFPGDTDWIRLGNCDLLEGMAQLTIVAKVRPDDASSQQWIIGNNGCWALEVNDERIRFRTWGGGSEVATYSNDPSVFDNTWHQIAGVYDGVNNNTYVDGIFNTSQAQSGAIPTGTTNFGIGSYSSAPSVLEFHGFIEFIYVYDRALSSREIADLYAKPFGMFRPTFSVWWYSGIGGEPPATFGQVIMISN